MRTKASNMVMLPSRKPAYTIWPSQENAACEIGEEAFEIFHWKQKETTFHFSYINVTSKTDEHRPSSSYERGQKPAQHIQGLELHILQGGSCGRLGNATDLGESGFECLTLLPLLFRLELARICFSPFSTHQHSMQRS